MSYGLESLWGDRIAQVTTVITAIALFGLAVVGLFMYGEYAELSSERYYGPALLPRLSPPTAEDRRGYRHDELIDIQKKIARHDLLRTAAFSLASIACAGLVGCCVRSPLRCSDDPSEPPLATPREPPKVRRRRLPPLPPEDDDHSPFEDLIVPPER